MRILLVEGDPEAARQLQLMVKSQRRDVYTADLGKQALDLGKLLDYDIILLASELPDTPGLQVLRSLRAAKVATPILMLGGPRDREHNVRDLCVGADGYMGKPVRKDELVARIDAIVRRAWHRAEAPIRPGDLVIDRDKRTVELIGERVHLTGKEYQILELLSVGEGRTVTRGMVLDHLYRGVDELALEMMDVLVAKLRRKLARASGGRNYIRDVAGSGFRLVDPA